MNSLLKKRLIIVGAVTAAVGVIGAIVYKLVTANTEEEFEEDVEDCEDDFTLEEIFADDDTDEENTSNLEEDIEDDKVESILDEE